MSFEDLKRDLTTDSYFDNFKVKKEIINSLNEKQFLSHIDDILLVFEENSEQLVTTLKMRYGLLNYKEHTLLEISKDLNIDVDKTASNLFSIRYACVFYYCMIYEKKHGNT